MIENRKLNTFHYNLCKLNVNRFFIYNHLCALNQIQVAFMLPVVWHLPHQGHVRSRLVRPLFSYVRPLLVMAHTLLPPSHTQLHTYQISLVALM